MGDTVAAREECYAAWTDAAHAIIEFEPVSMVVDPSEIGRARRMLSGDVEIVEAPLDEFWMRDFGPTFVLDDDRPGVLGAVDWTFNGWGSPQWAEWTKSAELVRLIAPHVGAELISSVLVNEGGGIHVDGEGTVLLTETVQLDPRRNPYADKQRVEAELVRTIGATHAIWLPRGLTRDYEDLGTNGHVDIVATIPSPGRLLLHDQTDPAHPDHEVSQKLRATSGGYDRRRGPQLGHHRRSRPVNPSRRAGFRRLELHQPPCGQRRRDRLRLRRGSSRRSRPRLLADAYPGRRVVSVEARPIFSRGGGIHCITQQQPRASAE